MHWHVQQVRGKLLFPVFSAWLPAGLKKLQIRRSTKQQPVEGAMRIGLPWSTGSVKVRLEVWGGPRSYTTPALTSVHSVIRTIIGSVLYILY